MLPHEHQSWKGGRGSLNKALRSINKYKGWRATVFQRDNYSCQNCGSRKDELEAHHIKRFSVYPELRYEISNGITLCKNCHRKTESYFRKTKVMEEV